MFKVGFFKALKRDYARTIAKALPRSVRSSIVKDNAREGLGLAGIPLSKAFSAAGKKRKYHEVLKKVHQGPIHLDTYIGSKLDSIMSHMPVGKNLFKTKETFRLNPSVTKTINGKRVLVENERLMTHQRPSVMAPLSKATEVAKPIVFGLAVDKVIKDNKKRKNEQQNQ